MTNLYDIIEDEGFFFRAVGPNFRGPLVSSAAAAGLMIRRRFGKDAQAEAAHSFLVRKGVRKA